MAEQALVRRGVWPPVPNGVGDGPRRIRYIQVGIAAGETADLPAITLRSAPSSCSALVP
jgi:hypothetical protein